MGSETPSGVMVRRLQDLRRCAEEAGLVGRVVQTTGTKPPVLVVINPDARALSEEISCTKRGDGDWWLVWSWGDPICHADDLQGAAAAIRRVVGGRS